MRAEFDEEETAAEARSRYLKEMMNIRKVTAEQLSDMTGISKRTLENYVSGRTDPAMGQGLRIALICYVLSMNAYTLGGANDIKPGTPFQSTCPEGSSDTLWNTAVWMWRRFRRNRAFRPG